MVDTEDLFRRLTSGAKFNKQRLNKELAYLRVSSYQYEASSALYQVPSLLITIACPVLCVGSVREGRKPGFQGDKISGSCSGLLWRLGSRRGDTRSHGRDEKERRKEEFTWKAEEKKGEW